MSPVFLYPRDPDYGMTCKHVQAHLTDFGKTALQEFLGKQTLNEVGSKPTVAAKDTSDPDQEATRDEKSSNKGEGLPEKTFK